MAIYFADFLDSDGTLIEDAGFINKTSEVIFHPFTFEVSLTLQEHFILYLTTNQLGIKKGITSEKKISKVNKFISKTLNKQDTIYGLFCYSQQSDDKYDCRKPKTLLIDKNCQLYNIGLNQSFIIGNHTSDVQYSSDAGIYQVYLLITCKDFLKIKIRKLVCYNNLEASIYIKMISYE